MSGKREYRTYAERERAEALAALDLNEGNVHRTAGQLGIPYRTLAEWAKGRGVAADVSRLRQVKKGELSAKFEGLAHTIVDSVTPEDIRKASLRDKMIAVGILTEKVLLLRGRPTQIVANSIGRETYRELQERFGLSEEEARKIVSEQFDIPESELEH